MTNLNQESMIKFCSYCGTKLDDDARFCKNCRQSIASQAQKSKTSNSNSENDKQAYSENPTERKTVYEGKIHKCPNCGEILEAFVTHCSSCGYEIRDTCSANSVKEFATKLERIETQQMPHFEDNRSVMKKLFGKDFNGDDYDLEQAKRDFEKRRKDEKANLISSFPVPNTKEDILEFLILASSNIDAKRWNYARFYCWSV